MWELSGEVDEMFDFLFCFVFFANTHSQSTNKGELNIADFWGWRKYGKKMKIDWEN